MSSKRSAAQDKKATNLELDKGLAASGADKKMDNFCAVTIKHIDIENGDKINNLILKKQIKKLF